ncbi:MAG TPA: hypothetical protein VFS47_06470 [Steroidobacteraceae bacterium]|nr:hypothetical protein [Steroidobacteraceae bacterium]
MNAKSLLMFMAIGMASLAVQASEDTSPTVDKMKAAVTPGEIVLTGNQVKKIHEGREAREYRVCVKTEADAAPMKVTYDGEQSVLMPGDCQNIVGRKIDASPQKPLSGKTHIVATFEHIKSKG